MAAPNDIILFHYPSSPFARKVVYYLALRGVNYAECIQPRMLPRLDLAALGIRYRRIPLLSIGRSVYCDTRLILEKLEELFPGRPKLSASTSDERVLQKLLASWTGEGGIFQRCAQALSPDLPALKDPNFIKDREDFSGGSWNPEGRKALVPEGLAHLQLAFDFLENELFADGRNWVLKTETASMADIDTVWPFSWILKTGSIPETMVSKQTHPRVLAYIDRFDKTFEAASSRLGKPTALSGAEAITHITQAAFPDKDEDLVVDQSDPLTVVVKKGQTVASWPVDSGSNHRDVGRLVKLDKQEVALEVEGVDGRPGIRVHHPRWNFRVTSLEESKL